MMKFAEYYEVIERKSWLNPKSKQKKEFLKSFKRDEWAESKPIILKLFKQLESNGGTPRVSGNILVFSANKYLQKNVTTLDSSEKKIKKFLEEEGFRTNPKDFSNGIIETSEGKKITLKEVLKSKINELSLIQKRVDLVDKNEKLIKAGVLKTGTPEYEKAQSIIENNKKTIERVHKFSPFLAAAKKMIGEGGDSEKKAVTEDFKLIFSCVPRHVASQSTGVAWQSCQNLDTGVYKNYVGSGASAGVFVVYLVKTKESDNKKLSIEEAVVSPLARVLVKPMANKNGEIFWFCDRVYPHSSPYQWLQSAVKSILTPTINKISTGKYTLKKGIYQDTKSNIDVDDVYKYYHLGDFSDLSKKPEDFKLKLLSSYFNDLEE